MKMFKRPIFAAILILILANIAIFWKFYLRGLLPFPGNLLVSYYFPWSSGGFAGFDSWTTRKAVVGMDVIRQMYPWRTLITNLVKSWQWPLWNPYNFSGTPLLANLQSSFFFPFHLLSLFFPLLPGWIGQVILLPFIFSLFIYLFLRSLKLSFLPSLFGAIILGNLSYLTVWAEQLIVIQTVLFLPLTLWSINKKRYFFTPFLLAFCIFGGHLQTATYIYILVFTYSLWRQVPLKIVFIYLVTSLFLAAVQLLPSLELYLYSARDSIVQQKFITATALPWQNLITILAPDFFGNPATNNFRGNNYDNSLAYFGVTAFFFAVYATIKSPFKDTRFWIILSITALFFALPILGWLPVFLRLPILGSSYLSRAVFLFEFSGGVLAATGFNYWLNSREKYPGGLRLAVVFIALYLVLWGITSTLPADFRPVSRHNLILPTIVIIFTSGIFLFGKNQTKKYLACIVVALAILEAGYFFQKYQPFSPAKFVFPVHPVFTFLQNKAGFNRFLGVNRAYIDSNFATYFRVFTPEGYDPLYIRRYGELLAASNNGHYTESIPPSDAVVGARDSFFRQRLLDLLGIKYLVDKTDDAEHDWGPNVDRFPEDKYIFIKQINKWKFYERKTALPRVFLSGEYEVETDKQSIVGKIYNSSFDLGKKVILEKEPQVNLVSDGLGNTEINDYSPNEVIISAETPTPKILFLSDNYYPGWKAKVDGEAVPIFRADYTFRAIFIKSGVHKVEFYYDPDSFRYGMFISLISLVVWVFGYLVIRHKTNKKLKI